MNILGIEFLPNVPNYYLYIGIVAVVLIIIYKNKERIFGKKEDEYTEINLEREINNEVKALFDISSKKIFKQKKLLRVGYNPIGRVVRIMDFNWSEKLIKNANPLKQVGKKTLSIISPKVHIKSFYGFEIIKSNFLGKIKYIFGFGKFFFLVDKELITDNPSEYVINPNSQPNRYFKSIWIFSEAGKDALLNVADRITLTETLQALANFIPRMTYLETKTAKLILKAGKLADIEKEKYLGRIEKLEKE